MLGRAASRRVRDEEVAGPSTYHPGQTHRLIRPSRRRQRYGGRGPALVTGSAALGALTQVGSAGSGCGVFAIRAAHAFTGERFRAGGATVFVDAGRILGVE